MRNGVIITIKTIQDVKNISAQQPILCDGKIHLRTDQQLKQI